MIVRRSAWQNIKDKTQLCSIKQQDNRNNMKKTTVLLLALAAFCGGMAGTTATADDSIRTIVLRQDDGQVRFGSRIYELKNVTSEAILPFVNAAILRYNQNSTIKRVLATAPDAKDAILVSTGIDFLPYVDEIVKALDHESTKKTARSFREPVWHGSLTLPVTVQPNNLNRSLIPLLEPMPVKPM